MIHEAVVWSEVHKKWFFLPRKASKSKYNDVDDERHGTNLLLVADEVPIAFYLNFLPFLSLKCLSNNVGYHTFEH